MNKLRNKKNKGFSLVELIIVIAIMAILAGILIPQFVRYIGNSRVSSDIQQAENIYNAIAARYADDAVAGTLNDSSNPMKYDGKLHEVDGTVSNALGMGSNAPTSKVDSFATWFYSCTGDGVVAVYTGPVASDGQAPNTGASGNATQISPSVVGPDASDWQ